MKKASCFSALSLIVVFGLLTSCRNNTSENNQTEAPHQHTYQCSKKCEGDKTYDQPGECPICTMALVEVVGR